MRKASRIIDIIVGLAMLVYAGFSALLFPFAIYNLFAKKEMLGLAIWELMSLSIFSLLFMYIAIIFFQKDKEKRYTIGFIVLLFWWMDSFISRFFFITNHKLESADFENFLVFLVPALFILLAKYLYQKSNATEVNNLS
jgi:hypothetical protein